MKIPAWARRKKVEREMEEEIAFHLASHAERLIRAGVPEAEAWRRARVEFGGVAGHKEAMRGALGLGWWDDLRSDVRYAWRALRRSPGFACVAVASLALGIGVNTAIFTLTSRVLLSRLSVPKPEQVRLIEWRGDKNVTVHEMWGNWNTLPGGGETSSSFSYPVYERLRAARTGLGELAGFKDLHRVNVTIGGSAETARAEMVSGNYYGLLGVRTQLGRPILPGDDGTQGSGAVVVIGDGFWARRFGRAPGAIGKTIEVNLTPMTIVGVNPPGFTGAEGTQSSPELFLPLSMQPVVSPMMARDGSLLENRNLWWMQIVARSREGTDERTSGAALDVALAAAVRSTMDVKAGETLPRVAITDGSRGLNQTRQYARPIYTLMGLAGLVLLLACVNIANLMLARAAGRRREMGVRLALGAGRGRILRQVLTESLVLAALGGAVGVALGYAARDVIPALVANSWERNAWAGGFDWRVFAYSAALTVATGLLFGLAPALRAMWTEAGGELKDDAHTATRRTGRTGRALVALQVGLATLLVAGAGLFLRTVARLDAVPLGFNANHLILFDIEPPAQRYPAGRNVEVLRQIEEAVGAVPGVESVTASRVSPISNSAENDVFLPEGQKRDPAHPHSSWAFLNIVGERFFSSMQTPILAGRGFDGRDTETSARVGVVNEALVKKFFAGRNPVGREFTTQDYDTGKDVVVEIVGVCANTRYASLRDAMPPLFYLPYRQASEGGLTFEARTSLPLEAMVGPLRKAVAGVDKDLPLIDQRTQREQIAATIKPERLFANLSAGFGVLALVLAATGVYGLMAYTVARRTNEIGIRMALGARAGQVMRMVLSEVSWIAAAGVAAGLVGAAAMTRLVAATLYGVKPRDPLSLALAGVVLAAVALAAGWLPARRAAKLDPMAALRHE